TFTNSVPPCDFITATATDPDGNTSEFSACAAVQGTAVVIATLTPAHATNLVNTTHSATETVTADGAPVQDLEIIFTVNGGNAETNLTDSAGKAALSYTSAATGTDTIRAVGVFCSIAFTNFATNVWVGFTEAPTITCDDITTSNAPGQCARAVSFTP